MNQLIKIGNQEISVKEFNGQRVITLKDIDFVHKRPEGATARKFINHQDRFIPGEDYVQRNSLEAENEYGIIAPEGLTLVTEQGYLMLAKSFTDRLAWEVQRQMINRYFKVRNAKSNLEMLELQIRALKEVDSKVDAVYDELQMFKQDMPILGIEEGKITSTVRAKGVCCLGGKESRAYSNKSLRAQVYSDIYRQLKREFGVVSYKAIKRKQCFIAVNMINNYELPFVLSQEINGLNI